MIHAAAATRTLSSPRRRPHRPAAWERAGSGIAMLALAGSLLAATTLLVKDQTADEPVFAVFVGCAPRRHARALAGLVLANARTIATTRSRTERVTFSEEGS